MNRQLVSASSALFIVEWVAKEYHRLWWWLVLGDQKSHQFMVVLTGIVQYIITAWWPTQSVAN